LVKTITQVASPTPSIVQRDIHTYTLTLSIILDVIEALQTSAQKEWDKQKTDLQNKPVITSVELNERENVAKHLMKAEALSISCCLPSQREPIHLQNV
jgi:cell division FtsZ-interacting protein ZapD